MAEHNNCFTKKYSKRRRSISHSQFVFVLNMTDFPVECVVAEYKREQSCDVKKVHTSQSPGALANKETNTDFDFIHWYRPPK